MEQILNLLGFTSTVDILWNLLAYVGMVLIIAAVVSAKWRNQFFVWGPLALLLYAWFYLGNSILAGLQFIIIASGVFNLLGIKRRISFALVVLTIIVYAVLLVTKQISGVWLWIGSFGLFGIAFGITRLPYKKGFTIMALGSLLIIIYAFALQIWAFFVLNVILFAANLLELRKKK